MSKKKSHVCHEEAANVIPWAFHSFGVGKIPAGSHSSPRGLRNGLVIGRCRFYVVSHMELAAAKAPVAISVDDGRRVRLENADLFKSDG